jgi:hypothetical protein
MQQCFGIVSTSVARGSEVSHAGPLRNVGERRNVRPNGFRFSRELTLGVMQSDWAFSAVGIDVLSYCESLFNERL